jgi:FKBP-type peptidyl-prolyl cis-trans isomerase FkpA
MTEVTRVPLQPIAKGSLTKLWLGVLAAIVIAIGFAWSSMPKGLSVDVITQGSGPTPGPTDVIFVNYKGSLADTGEVFDESQSMPLPVPGIFPEGTPLPLDRMIPGFGEGAQQMQKGGEYVLNIPSDKGYGPSGQADPQGNQVIPPNADLKFEIELIDFMSQEDFDRRLQQLQAAMAEQGIGPGGPGGPPPPQ